MGTRLNQPLRIFFGQFYNAGFHYAQSNGDQIFPDFLTGIAKSGFPDLRLHTRKPTGASGDITNFDEYLDLQAQVCETEEARTIKTFRNLAGVQSDMYWSDELLKFDPTNVLKVETESIEFEQPTRRLSLPYPKTTPVAPPQVFIENTSYDPNSITGYFKFFVTIWNNAGTVESSPSLGAVIPYTAVTDNITITIRHLATTSERYSIYRVPVSLDAFRQEWLNQELIKVLNAYHKILIPSATSFSVTADFCDEATIIYDATPIYLTEPALNDARARMKFDYLVRRRMILGVPTQRLLVLNLKTHHYYLGSLIVVSPYFIMGGGSTQAIFHMSIHEEGAFIDLALTAPNTTANFTTFDRSFV